MSVDVLDTDLETLLSLTQGLDIAYEPTGSVRILQHFQAFTSLTIGSAMCKGVMHNFVAKVSFGRACPGSHARWRRMRSLVPEC